MTPRAEQLIAVHLERLSRFAAKLSFKYPAIEQDDLLQETIMKALQAWDGFDGGEEYRWNWLATVMKNIWISEIRQFRPTKDMADFYEGSLPALISHPVQIDHVYCSEVAAAIQRLPSQSRSAMELAGIGKSVDDIKSHLGVSKSRVDVILRTARKRLEDMGFDLPKSSRAMIGIEAIGTKWRVRATVCGKLVELGSFRDIRVARAVRAAWDTARAAESARVETEEQEAGRCRDRAIRMTARDGS